MGKYGISGEKGYRPSDYENFSKKPKCVIVPHLEKMRAKFDDACIAPRSKDPRWANTAMDGTVQDGYTVRTAAREAIEAEMRNWFFAFCTKTGKCSVPCESKEKAERIAAKKMESGEVFKLAGFLDYRANSLRIAANRIGTSQNWMAWFDGICKKYGFAWCFVSDSINTYLEVVYIHQEPRTSRKCACFEVLT